MPPIKACCGPVDEATVGWSRKCSIKMNNTAISVTVLVMSHTFKCKYINFERSISECEPISQKANSLMSTTLHLILVGFYCEGHIFLCSIDKWV